MKWVTGAARARFLAAFERSKAVPPEAGASLPTRFRVKNGVLDAGALLGGLHAGHFRPRDHGRTAQGGANDGEHPLPCGVVLSAIRSRWGQRLGQEKVVSENGNL